MKLDIEFLTESIALMETKYRKRIKIIKEFLPLYKVNNKMYFKQGTMILNCYIANEYYEKGMRLCKINEMPEAKAMLANVH